MPNLFCSLEATVCRAHDPNWAWDWMSGEGAKRNGGRFNWPGLDALYVSLEVKTAMAEAQQGFARKMQPMTIIYYDLKSETLLDLTNMSVLEALDSTPEMLNDAWGSKMMSGDTPDQWPLIDACLGQGAAGVIVPSFAPGSGDGKNIVLYDWGPTEKSKAQLVPIDDHGRRPPKGN